MPIAKVLLIQGGLWELLSHMSFFGWLILGVLLVMSLMTWGIILNKWKVYKAAHADGARFHHTFRRRTSVKEAHSKCLLYKSSPMTRVFEEGYREWESLIAAKNGSDRKPGEVVKLEPDEMEAIDRILEKESNEQIKILEKNVAFLATAANSAPFIGLLRYLLRHHEFIHEYRPAGLGFIGCSCARYRGSLNRHHCRSGGGNTCSNGIQLGEHEIEILR